MVNACYKKIQGNKKSKVHLIKLMQNYWLFYICTFSLYKLNRQYTFSKQQFHQVHAAKSLFFSQHLFTYALPGQLIYSGDEIVFHNVQRVPERKREQGHNNKVTFNPPSQVILLKRQSLL